MTYRDAGVNIEAGNRLVKAIAPLAQRTRRPEVLTGLGGFGGLFELPEGKYRQPVLVSGTDGVGTKLQLAQKSNRHDTIGIDLVAMCVNDVIVCGAEPLFFLDYFACATLDTAVAEQVIAGIAAGCEQAGAALIGGETAEMPGMYAPGEYDLAGFCVGVVEKSEIIDGSKVRPDQAVIGLHANGAHSNGFSLIRRILERSGISPTSPEPEHAQRIAALLKPTLIYVRPVLDIISTHPVFALAHITGGGLGENLARVLPSDCDARVDTANWSRPPVFDWLQQQGDVTDEEMLRTFNCGIGMALVTETDSAYAVIDSLRKSGFGADVIGTTVPGSGQVHVESG